MNRLLCLYRSLLAALLVGLAPCVVAQTLLSDGQHPRQLEALQFATAWVELYDHGRDAATYAMLAPSLQETITETRWRAQLSEQNAKLGSSLGRMPRPLAWRETTPPQPMPGLYVSIEFDGRFEKAAKHVHSLQLYAADGGPFVVLHHNARFTLSKPQPGSGGAR